MQVRAHEVQRRAVRRGVAGRERAVQQRRVVRRAAVGLLLVVHGVGVRQEAEPRVRAWDRGGRRSARARTSTASRRTRRTGSRPPPTRPAGPRRSRARARRPSSERIEPPPTYTRSWASRCSRTFPGPQSRRNSETCDGSQMPAVEVAVEAHHVVVGVAGRRRDEAHPRALSPAELEDVLVEQRVARAPSRTRLRRRPRSVAAPRRMARDGRAGPARVCPDRAVQVCAPREWTARAECCARRRAGCGRRSTALPSGPVGSGRRAVDGRRRGGGDAARAGRLAGVALRGRARAAATSSRPHARRDARARAGDRHRSAPDGRRGGAQLRAAACRARRRPCAVARAVAPRWRGRIRWRGPRTSRSRRARATSTCTRRCASWPGGSRRSRCTCTSPSPTPSSPSARWTACAATSRSCSRWRRTRRSRAAPTAGWRRRARRSSRRSRAPACRARSAPTTPTSRRSTCCCAAARSPSRRSSGGTCGCSRGSARSSCA